MKISEAEGTVDIEEMHNLQERLQMLNGELSQAKDYKQQLEKHLKSAEVSVTELRRVINDGFKKNIELKRFRMNPTA